MLAQSGHVTLFHCRMAGKTTACPGTTSDAFAHWKPGYKDAFIAMAA
jgi:hypothetical protein